MSRLRYHLVSERLLPMLWLVAFRRTSPRTWLGPERFEGVFIMGWVLNIMERWWYIRTFHLSTTNVPVLHESTSDTECTYARRFIGYRCLFYNVIFIT